MKHTLLFLALASIFAMPAFAQNKTKVPRLNPGVGPAVNVSQVQDFGDNMSVLPENAQTFINTLFPNVAVADVRRADKHAPFEVKMANGYEIDFNLDGTWSEVEAPEDTPLDAQVVRNLVPENVVVTTLEGDSIVKGGLINYVEEMANVPGFGYIVEFSADQYSNGKVAVNSTTGQPSTMKEFKRGVKTGAIAMPATASSKMAKGNRAGFKAAKKGFQKGGKAVKKGYRKGNVVPTTYSPSK